MFPFLSVAICFLFGFFFSCAFTVFLFWKYLMIAADEIVVEKPKPPKKLSPQELRDLSIEKKMELEEDLFLYQENQKRSLSPADKPKWESFLDQIGHKKNGEMEMLIPERSELHGVDYETYPHSESKRVVLGEWLSYNFSFGIYDRSALQKYVSLFVYDKSGQLGRIHLTRCEVIECRYPRGMKQLEGTAHFLKLVTMEKQHIFSAFPATELYFRMNNATSLKEWKEEISVSIIYTLFSFPAKL